MRRYVRRGSEGIALIHKDKSGKPYLEHVFDVSDTGALPDGKPALPVAVAGGVPPRRRTGACAAVRRGRGIGHGQDAYGAGPPRRQ